MTATWEETTLQRLERLYWEASRRSHQAGLDESKAELAWLEAGGGLSGPSPDRVAYLLQSISDWTRVLAGESACDVWPEYAYRPPPDTAQQSPEGC